MNCLFIGGPIDGQRKVVPENMQSVQVAALPDLAKLIASAVPPEEVPVLSTTTYYRCDLAFLPGVAIFVTDPNASPGDIMRQLLDGYRLEVKE